MEVLLNFMNHCPQTTAESSSKTDNKPNQAFDKEQHCCEVQNVESYAHLQKEGNQTNETTNVYQSSACSFGIHDDMPRARKFICSFAPIVIKSLLHLLDRNGHRMDSAETCARNFADLFKHVKKKNVSTF